MAENEDKGDCKRFWKTVGDGFFSECPVHNYVFKTGAECKFYIVPQEKSIQADKTQEFKGIKEFRPPILSTPQTKTQKKGIYNRMWVGEVGSKRTGFVFYQPHNYRLYFDFDKEGFDVKKLASKVGLEVGLGGLVVTKRNYNSELSVRFVNDCEIIVKKSMVEVRNFVEHKRWFKITLGEGAEAEILKIIKEKDLQCIDALKDFMKIFGGSSDFIIRNRFSEDKITAEDFIDSLPLKMKFKNELAKKVYNEGNVEFNSPILASNYVRNQALEPKAPLILTRLDSVDAEIRGLNKGFSGALDVLKNDALVPLTAQIKLHLEVQKDTKDVLTEIKKSISKLTRVVGKPKGKMGRNAKVRRLLRQQGW